MGLFELGLWVALHQKEAVNNAYILTNQIIDEFIQTIKDWQVIFADYRSYLPVSLAPALSV